MSRPEMGLLMLTSIYFSVLTFIIGELHEIFLILLALMALELITFMLADVMNSNRNNGTSKHVAVVTSKSDLRLNCQGKGGHGCGDASHWRTFGKMTSAIGIAIIAYRERIAMIGSCASPGPQRNNKISSAQSAQTSGADRP